MSASMCACLREQYLMLCNRVVARVPTCSIRGTNNQFPNIFYEFVHFQLLNIKHKIVHLQVV